MSFFDQLLNVSSENADDVRRRKLLNILLSGLVLIAVSGLIALGIASIVNLLNFEDAARLFYAFGSALLGFILLFLINRYVSGALAGVLFALFLIAVISVSDDPIRVVDGRTTFLFSIPIMVASVVLPSWASFGAAAASSVAVSIVAVYALDGIPPIPSMFGFFAVALVSWIAARSLEQALDEVRQINRHLDDLVQKRTRELADALSENQAILNSIADGVLVFNTDGRVAVANPAVSRLLSRPDDAIIGRTLEGLMGQEVAEEDRTLVVRMLRGDPEVQPPLKFEWGHKTFSVSCAPVMSEGGRLSGTVTVFRDFTREAEIERMKSVFVSMVSHELRTPLNAILGYADMLKESVYGPLNNMQNEAIRRIMANASRQLSLVNDLLDRAQIEAGTLSFNYAPLNLADLLRDVYATMSVLSTAKGLTLNCHIAPNMPKTIIGDPQRLYQILINLINNAIKFTEQGQVDVEVFPVNRNHWGIRVADTGIGLPDDAHEYIFEPFRRVDSSATRKQGGVGLGLSIVKQLVELMNGSISVSSQLGVGSTFTVIMPIESTTQNAKEKK